MTIISDVAIVSNPYMPDDVIIGAAGDSIVVINTANPEKSFMAKKPTLFFDCMAERRISSPGSGEVVYKFNGYFLWNKE